MERERVHYRNWNLGTATAIFVSEPVIDPTFVRSIKDDLGEDVEITVVERDRPFNLKITIHHNKKQ